MIEHITKLTCTRCVNRFEFKDENEQLTSELSDWVWMNVFTFRDKKSIIRDEPFLCPDCFQSLMDWLSRRD